MRTFPQYQKREQETSARYEIARAKEQDARVQSSMLDGPNYSACHTERTEQGLVTCIQRIQQSEPSTSDLGPEPDQLSSWENEGGAYV
jgi:hypothetical protein